MNKEKEDVAILITKFLYEIEADGVEMSHFSEVGWRLSVKLHKAINREPSQPTPKEDWEKDFDKKFDSRYFNELATEAYYGDEDTKALKEFIRSLLSSQKQELLKKVEEEAIGKDEVTITENYRSSRAVWRNELREEQRKALKALKEEDGK